MPGPHRASRSGVPAAACTLHVARMTAANALPRSRGGPVVGARSADGGSWQRIFPLATLSLLLALLAGPVSASAAASPPGAFADHATHPGTDGEITTRIQARLMVRRDIEFADIDVWTTDGVVRLAGVVDSPAQVRKAVAIARTVRGVRAVDASALSAHAD